MTPGIKAGSHVAHTMSALKKTVDGMAATPGYVHAGWTTEQVIKTVYAFSNHYHPFVGALIKELTDRSLIGLFDVNFQQRLGKITIVKNAPRANTSDSRFEVHYPPETLDLEIEGPYANYNWELLFHAPLAVAVNLSRNQRFQEAQRWFHYIFNPTSNDTSANPPKRFWNFLEFREHSDVELINDLLTGLSRAPDDSKTVTLLKSIDEWRSKPFQPHVVARARPSAYMFYVIMKYLDNLIAWGDALFRQDTIESINEATQLYVLAANILGSKPEEIPPLSKTKPVTYAELRKRQGSTAPNAFTDWLEDAEAQFPLDVAIPSTKGAETAQTKTLFGMTQTLYFCIQQNDKLLGYWDTVADRLFKVRHCMNIEGVLRPLPLFEPSIDPGLLVKAAAAGIDISSIVSGLTQPPSLVRAPLLIQKALEICAEVKALGSGLLSALEKHDAEELALLRQGQEIAVLNLIQDVKFNQWKEAEASTEALRRTRAVVFQRYQHYERLLGNTGDALQAASDLTVERGGVELTEDNFDTVYDALVTKYDSTMRLEAYREEQQDGDIVEQAATWVSDVGLADDGATLQLNRSESKELNTFMPLAHDLQQTAAAGTVIASALSLIPQFPVYLQPLGLGAGVEFGGRQLSQFATIMAEIVRMGADELNYRAVRASKFASYQRRIEDWVLQSNLAARELMQTGRQLIAAVVREQITRREYENHKKQIELADTVETFLKGEYNSATKTEGKFTTSDFYAWMQAEVSRIYYECYKFAFDIAKKAEQTLKHELMREELDNKTFVSFNYWDSGRKGLLAGDALYLDLKRLEMAYYDFNKRELRDDQARLPAAAKPQRTAAA